MRQVPRSQPTYRRRLLFATALFTVLFVADLLVVGDLAFRDLSHRVVDEAFRASLQALEVDPVPTVPEPVDPGLPSPQGTEECPAAAPQTPALPEPCRHAPREDESVAVFPRHGDQVERIVADTRGNIRKRWFGRVAEGAVDMPAASRHPQGSTWRVDDLSMEVITVAQAAPPGSRALREVAIPREEIEKDLAQIRRDLTTKVWLGAGAAVLILVVAFAYVLRLLHRTRQLEAQAQMDDRLAYVGGLAAGLAHEIRNPLNVLSMNLQMLEEEIAGREGSDEAKLYLQALQGEIRRLSTLVNNFLSYARPGRLRFEPCDVNRVLREICRLFRPEFEARKLVLREDLTPYMPPVDLDESQFRQAVMNIIQNAQQILEPGGCVTVESRVGPAGEALIAIEDDGPGIRPEDRDRIFEVFVSGRRGGTGLGLPIAARILQAHGGSIEVAKRPAGQGARFVLTLPRRQPAAQPLPETAAKDDTAAASGMS